MNAQELLGAEPAYRSTSRTSDEGAGWTPETTDALAELPDAAWVALACEQPTGDLPSAADGRALRQLPRKLTWFRAKVLWGTRNDFIARLSDPTAGLRRRHVGDPDRHRLSVDLTTPAGQGSEGPLSFLLMGDTGEGDCSQYALVPPLTTVAARVNARFLLCAAMSSIRWAGSTTTR